MPSTVITRPTQSTPQRAAAQASTRPTPAGTLPTATRIIDRHRWALLVVGAVCWLLAVPSSHQIAALAWVAWPALLIWARQTRRTPAVIVGISAVSILVSLWLLRAASFDHWLALLLVPLLILPVDLLPVLADRAAWRRLPAGAALLVFPATRVGMEYALANINPLGGLVSTLGYSQFEATALIQIAAITGVYGVSFLIALVAAAGAELATGRAPGAGRRTAAVLGIIALLVVAGQVRLVNAQQSVTPTITVAGISPDPVLFAAANNSATLEQALSYYPQIKASMLEATRAQAAAGASIVVWAEHALWPRPEQVPALIAEVRQIALEHQVDILVAYGHLGPAGTTVNRAVLVRADGSIGWEYDKRRPIPGVEAFDRTDTEPPTAQIAGALVSTAICFDTDFPETTRPSGRAGVDLLLSPTLDWAGIEIFHQQGVTFRAVENGFWVVRQASQGHAQVIDPYGQRTALVVQQPETQQIMVAEVGTQGTGTWYPWLRDGFALLAGAVAIALQVWALQNRRRPQVHS